MTTLIHPRSSDNRIRRYPVIATRTRHSQVVLGVMHEGGAWLYEAPEFRPARRGEIVRDGDNQPRVVVPDNGPAYQTLVNGRNVTREVAVAYANARYWTDPATDNPASRWDVYGEPAL